MTMVSHKMKFMFHNCILCVIMISTAFVLFLSDLVGFTEDVRYSL